ncbi:MAG: hypothetical protein EPN82_13005 [Bacteroidetes bacterium]|nr:MAG: hypothetical protein EPN82_13005 [Bacteroidota bacterium]
MAKHITLLVSCLLICLANQNLFSQPTISIEFPSQGATNISLLPQIKIMVNSPYKIDESCLNLSDTIPYNNWDSVNNRHYISEMTVFPSSYYEGNDSTLQMALWFGTRTKNILINDSTFQILLFGRLGYETEYGIYIDDIRVYDPQTSDTLTFDTLLVPQFTTTKPMYRVENISSNGNVIRTGDTVFIYFNRDLDSANTPLGPIATIYKSDTTTIDDTLRYIFNEVSSTSFLGDTSTTICIKPDTNYTLGNEYFLKVDLFGLTGDSSNNIFTTIPLKEKAMVNTLVKSLNALDTLPIEFSPKMNTKTYFLEPNENLAFDVSKYDSNYFFVGWECPDNISINGYTETSHTVSFEPEQLQDLDITAVYAKIHQDTVKLSSVANGSYSAFTPGVAVNDSVYTLPRKEGDKMLIIAIPNPEYKFSYWESDDTLLDGNTEPYLEINAYPNVNVLSTSGTWSDIPDIVTNIYPVFESDTSSCQMAEICVTVSLEDGSEIFTGTSSNEDSTDVKDLIEYVKVDTDELDLTGDGLTAKGCKPIYNPNLPLSKTISVKLNMLSESKYEIAYYYDIGNKFNIQQGRKFPDYQNGDTVLGRLADPYGDSVGTEFSQFVTLDDPDRCYIDLKVVIYRRRCHLSTELMMEDTSYLPYDNVINIFFNRTRTGSIAKTELGNNRRNEQEWIEYDTNFLQTTYFKKVTWYKIIPYGDTVYLKGELLLNDRGYDSAYWYGEDGYVNSPIIDASLVLIMTDNEKTKYILDNDFKLEAIYIYPDWTTEKIFDISKGYPTIPPLHIIRKPGEATKRNFLENNIKCGMREYTGKSVTQGNNPYPNPTLHDNGHSEESNYLFRTAKIKFRFSRDVMENTLVDPNFPIRETYRPDYGDDKNEGLHGWDWYPKFGYDIDELYPWDYLIGRRYDAQIFKNYYYNSATCTTIGNYVTMKFISPNGFGLPHMSYFNIHVGNYIKSTSGKTLTNKGTAQFGTEYPNIQIKLLKYISKNYSVHYGSGNSFFVNLADYKHAIILCMGVLLKQYDYVITQKYTFEDPTIQHAVFPPTGCYNNISPDNLIIPEIPENYILNCKLYEDGQYTIVLPILADINSFELEYIDFFWNGLIDNLFNYKASILDFAKNPTSYLLDRFLLSIFSNYNLPFMNYYQLVNFQIEKYAFDGNWGIWAFPGNRNDENLYLKDYNCYDKYRYLYLWRTYYTSLNGYRANYGIEYKIILK